MVNPSSIPPHYSISYPPHFMTVLQQEVPIIVAIDSDLQIILSFFTRQLSRSGDHTYRATLTGYPMGDSKIAELLSSWHLP